MANKIVKIPVADIEGLQNDGKYILRYRVASKDKRRISDWSELYNLSFPLDSTGKTSSFYQLYGTDGVTSSGRPILDNGTDGLDPHPGDPYLVNTVRAAIGDNYYVESNITYAQDDSKMYTYSWGSLSDFPVRQEFDVYLSWKYTASGWSDWKYAGTTTSNTFNFKKPASTAQWVQAAVFLSSYPKMTNIYRVGETTFVSISSQFSTFQDVGNSTLGTITSPGTGGKYYGTISSIVEPVPAGVVGRRVFVDGSNFANKTVTVKSVNTGTNTMTVESSVSITAGTLANLRL